MKVRRWAIFWLERAYRTSGRKGFRRGFIGVCAVVILIVGGPIGLGAAAHISYGSKNYGAAQRVWRIQSVVAWYDKDIPPANAGLAYYQLTMLSPAVDQLERALSIAHPSRECHIRWNLAVALAARASQRTQSSPNDAVGDYARAINVLSSEYCLSQSEYRDKFQDYIKVLADKMAALIEQISAQHERPEDTKKEQEPTTTPTDDDKADKAKKQQNDYQNATSLQRYNGQSEDEKTRGYSESAW